MNFFPRDKEGILKPFGLSSQGVMSHFHVEDTDDDQISDDGGIDMAEDFGLDTAVTGPRPMSTPDQFYLSSPRIDSYRFSMANLEDSQDIELDAILGELCALESQFDRELLGQKGHHRSASSVSQNSIGISAQRYSTLSHSNSGGVRAKLDTCSLPGELEADDPIRLQKTNLGSRTDSPDNDSAFSDNVSMLSSESSASSGIGMTRSDPLNQSISSKSSSSSLLSYTQADHAARIKAEKIKIALEKIREASIKKLFIKAFTEDGSAKSLLVDEKMNCGFVAKLLADKNHTKMDPKWAIVEHIPDLHMERIYEDHEYLVENLLLWTRDSKNKLHFLEKSQKYDLFVNPQNYLLNSCSSEKGLDLDEEAKSTLIEEFFSSSGVLIPDIEGILYLKSEGKKAWKKHYFVLRASGIYYCPKGKSKSSKDLICLITFEINDVYFGVGWKKKYKAPTEYGFAIKHPQIQTKSAKYIKYLCAEDEYSLRQWVTGIRIAKYGHQLFDNYRCLVQELVEEDLEVLAQARSCSMFSMPQDSSCTSPVTSCPVSPPDCEEISLPYSSPSSLSMEQNWGSHLTTPRKSTRSSSSSSGCLSEHSSNGTCTPTSEQTGFDADFPTGTIKRKPSMTPKIPLTSTTRNLAKQSMAEDSITSALTLELNTKFSNGRNSLRRSLTDDKLNIHSTTNTSRKQSLNEKSGTDSNELKDEIDNLPLPPPPLTELGTSVENLTTDEILPPPPPEAYQSTLSLDSLPPYPPTPPIERRSNTSLNSLPPPPPPITSEEETYSHYSRPPPPSPQELFKARENLRHEGKYAVPQVLPKPAFNETQRRCSEMDVSHGIPPTLLSELKAYTVLPNKLTLPRKYSMDSSSILNKAAINSQDIQKGSKTIKQISFEDEIKTPAPPPPPPPLPPAPEVFDKSCIRNKPPPPRRSDTTRLSTIPVRQNSLPAQLTPPKAFLADLHRVMEKKWKMAQQLSLDLSSSSYPVMGFRDPIYGEDGMPIELNSPDVSNMPTSKNYCDTWKDVKTGSTPKKKPPPPPPKRSDTTQLSAKAP